MTSFGSTDGSRESFEVDAAPDAMNVAAAPVGMRRILRTTLVCGICVTGLLGAVVAWAVCVPTVYNVTSSAPPPSGNWTDTTGAVWTPAGGYPGCAPGDSAMDANPSPTTLIVNSSVPNPIIGLNLSCAGCVIDIQPGGSLTLAGPGTIGNGATVSLNGGTLNVALGGSLSFNSGSQLTLNSGNLDVQTGGQLTLPNGTSTVASGATLGVSGGTLTIPPAATLSIQSGGLLDLTAGSIDGGGTISSAGFVTVNTAGTFDIDATFDTLSGSSTNINAGTLSLPAGGTGAGPFTIGSGAYLDFPSGTYTLTTGGVVTGAGTLSVSGGTLSIGGVTSPDGFSLSAGTMTGNGFLSVGQNLDWSGGTITGNGGTELAGNGFGVLSGSNGPMILDGRVLNDYGSIDFNSTTSDLVLKNGAALGVFGQFRFTGSGTSSIVPGTGSGSVTVSPNGALESDDGNPSILVPFENDASTYAFNGSTLIIGGDGTHNGFFYADSSSTLQFQAATTIVNGSIFTDGSIAIPAGSTEIDGGYTVNGSTKVSGGLLTFIGQGDTSDLALTAGTIDLEAQLTVRDSGTWSGGTIGGTDGSLLVDGGATVTIDASVGDAVLDTILLENDGSILYTASGASSFQVTSGAEIDNYGTFDIQNDAMIASSLASARTRSFAPRTESNPAGSTPSRLRPDLVLPVGGSFYNYGIFRKSSGSGTTDFAPDFFDEGAVSAESGTLHFLGAFEQTDGVTTLGPGGIQVDNALILTGGSLEGNGTIDGDVEIDDGGSGGSVAPGTGAGTGTIDITGNYTQQSEGTLVIDLESDTIADQVTVGGTATLDGSFTATILGAYVPTSGTTWSVLTFASRSGDFANYTLPTNSPAPSTITNSYTATELDLTATTVADLGVAVNGPASVNAGDSLQYTVDVMNNGPNATEGTTTVTNTLPAGATGASGAGSGWVCGAPSGGMITCTTYASIAGGDPFPTLTFSMNAPTAGGSITNSATVSSANDPSAGNDSGLAMTTVIPQADLSITKTGPAGVTSGDDVVYTIVVTNNGPSASSGVTVDDPTPANLTFVSNSGDCTGAFPCNLGTMTNGQTATITSTWSTSSAFTGSVTNTAGVSSSTSDPDSSNDSDSATTTVSSGPPAPSADLAVSKLGPVVAIPGSEIAFDIFINDHGPSDATGVVLSDATPPGLQLQSVSGDCTSLPCTIANMTAHTLAQIHVTYLVTAAVGNSIVNTATVTVASPPDPNLANNSASATVEIIDCPTEAPQILAPDAGSTVGSPITLQWSAVEFATSYSVVITGSQDSTLSSTGTSINASLPNGSYTWTVRANGASECESTTSQPSTFSVCNPPTAPVISAIATSTSGQDFIVQWEPVDGATSYLLQESTDSQFEAATESQLSDLSKTFTKSVTNPTAFFYRVRAAQTCSASAPPFSPTATVVVVPLPGPHDDPSVTVPAVGGKPVTFQLFVPGLPSGTTSFVATPDKPWISVTPFSGIVAPEGTVVTISLDPSTLTNGTWTGTVLIAYGSVGVSGGTASEGTTTVSIPVTISLVTPVTPSAIGSPSADALVIPTISHGDGLASQWRSDVRLANITDLAKKYQLIFNSGSLDASSAAKQTTVSVDANATMALDDIVRNWYGVGPLGDSANGTLIIEPIADGSQSAADEVDVSKVSVVASSRTYDAATNGTLGQFIPALRFADFIGSSGALSSILSLQQLAQSAQYRTNVGLAEAAGQPANVLLTVFDNAGTRLLESAQSLSGGELRQINGFLAQHDITLDNGRIEAKVTSGNGRVTAYASVIDNLTNDPLAIWGFRLGGIGSDRFVVPGVADLNTAGASWRSDLRLFNSGSSVQPVSLTFYPLGEPGAGVTREISINPGETRALDNILASLFGLTDVGGALHVTTSALAPLVVTARTYDQTESGTVGQFIPAVTAGEAVGIEDGALQILQAEESARYRTNLGLVEVTGKPATVEISVFLPDSKITPIVDVPLAGFEARQLPLLGSLGLGATYNVRIGVRVVGGEGRVTAYGSIIDQKTDDPTYVPAQ